MFETASRKLEQFLYSHDILHIGIHKDEDGMTVWEYADTDELRRVVAEFREIEKRRQIMYPMAFNSPSVSRITRRRPAL